MKTKNFRIYFITYILALVLSVSSSTILQFFATDPQTGFLVVNPSLIFTILIYVSRISLALPIAVWFGLTFRRRAKHDYPVSYQHVFSGILSVITGLCVIAYTFVSVGPQVLNIDSLSYTETGFLQTDFNKKMILMSVIIFGFLGGISMVVGGIKSKYLVSGKPGAVLGFAPALWQLIILLSRFNSFIAVTTIWDNLMIVMFMSFAAMFLIGQSRIIFGLGIRNGKTYAIPAGLSVSLVGLTFSITCIASYIVRGSFTNVLVINWPEMLYVLFLSLYALVFVKGFVQSIKVV